MRLNPFTSKATHPANRRETASTSFQVKSVFGKNSKIPFTGNQSTVETTEKNKTSQRIIDKAIEKTLVEAKKPTKSGSNIKYETLFNHVIFRATSEFNARLNQKANEIEDRIKIEQRDTEQAKRDKKQAEHEIQQARLNIEKNLKKHLNTDSLMNSGPLRTYLVSQMEKNMACLSKEEREKLITLAYEQLDQHIDEIIRAKKLDTYSVKEITQYANLLVNNEFPEKIKEVVTPPNVIHEKRTFKKLLKRDQDFPMAFRHHQR